MRQGLRRPWSRSFLQFRAVFGLRKLVRPHLGANGNQPELLGQLDAKAMGPNGHSVAWRGKSQSSKAPPSLGSSRFGSTRGVRIVRVRRRRRRSAWESFLRALLTLRKEKKKAKKEKKWEQRGFLHVG